MSVQVIFTCDYCGKEARVDFAPHHPSGLYYVPEGWTQYPEKPSVDYYPQAGFTFCSEEHEEQWQENRGEG